MQVITVYIVSESTMLNKTLIVLTYNFKKFDIVNRVIK